MVDSSLILRALIGPVDREDSAGEPEFLRAAQVLRQVARGEIQITMTDATIAEIVIALSSPRHFGLTREETAGRMRALLGDVGVRISGRTAALAALDRWALDPAIGFTRALTIERAIESGAVLAGDE